jgi:Crinkler effector protein N-terminal domain
MTVLRLSADLAPQVPNTPLSQLLTRPDNWLEPLIVTRGFLPFGFDKLGDTPTLPMASSSSSINQLSLLYQIIDDQGNLLGALDSVDIPSNAHVGNLKRQILSDNKNILEAHQVDAPQLILWKLLKQVVIGHPRAYNKEYFSSIQEISFPKSKSDDVGDGHIQYLDPAHRLSTYWKQEPKDGYLALVVQLPRTS